MTFHCNSIYANVLVFLYIMYIVCLAVYCENETQYTLWELNVMFVNSAPGGTVQGYDYRTLCAEVLAV